MWAGVEPESNGIEVVPGASQSVQARLLHSQQALNAYALAMSTVRHGSAK